MRRRVTMSERPRVVVAGAGFAGVKVAKELAGHADVTVLAPTHQFVYLPMIHEVLSETSLPRTVTRDLDEVLPEAEHRYGRAQRLDGDELVTTDGERIGFDQLVVAVGAAPNDFGVPGVDEHALSFYSVGDALRANATLKHTAAGIGERPLRVTVVGASFTGVEVAGEVADLLDSLDVEREITLLEARDTIFPHQSATFRETVHDRLDALDLELELKRLVSEVREDEVLVGEGSQAETLSADVTFWCAGVRPRTIEGVDHRVDATLRSRSREDVFVVGDAASFPDQDVPKLAQTAESQAEVAVHNILHPDDPRTYDLRVRGLILSIGQGFAVAEVTDGPVFKGRVPWHVKRNLYKVKMKLA